MRFYRRPFGIGAMVIGIAISVGLLFGQNSGILTFDNTVVATAWWILAWPFTLVALIVASSTTGNNMSPAWGIPVLLLAIVLNVIYFYMLGQCLEFLLKNFKRS